MFPTGKVAKYCIFSTKSRAVLYGDNKHEKIPKVIQKVNKIGVQLTRFDQNLLDKFKPFVHSKDISSILPRLPHMITISPDSMATRSFGKRCKKVVGFSSGGKRHASERPDRGGGAPVQQGGDHSALQGMGLLFAPKVLLEYL